MAVRRGHQRAVLALAHHMLVVVYNVFSRQEEYVELGADYYDQRNKPKVVPRLVKRLTARREASDGISCQGPVADGSSVVTPYPLPERQEVPVQPTGSVPEVDTATIRSERETDRTSGRARNYLRTQNVPEVKSREFS
jgi:hypothetical protein